MFVGNRIDNSKVQKDRACNDLAAHPARYVARRNQALGIHAIVLQHIIRPANVYGPRNLCAPTPPLVPQLALTAGAVAEGKSDRYCRIVRDRGTSGHSQKRKRKNGPFQIHAPQTRTRTESAPVSRGGYAMPGAGSTKIESGASPRFNCPLVILRENCACSSE